MMTTILRLRAHSRELFGLDDKDLKIIVWAHNSHVGDATATPMGGMNFERNEKWNLGQMCRSTLESVFIVGFYSFCGEVRAAKKWGGEGQVMSLTPAVPYSFEHRLHEWFPQQRAQFPLHKVREVSKRFEYVPQRFPLNVEYRALHPMVRVSKEVMPQNQSVEAEEVGGDGSLKHKHPTLDPTKPFTAVSRTQVGRQGEVVRLQIRGYDRGQYDGWWVTEYTRHGSRTIHCLPSSHLNALSGPLPTPEKARALANFPILQRWVGVQYHPETEIESHYGEMAIAKCYDLAVFVDKTRALDIDMTASTPLPVSAALNEGEKQAPTESSGAGSRHNRRLLMEYRRILKNPIEYIEARPLDTNILEWHFVITGNQDPYTGGKYHGILEFPDDFPMKPPSIKMLTPSGRFEINKRICLSMSDFHKESWNPSWTVEKILIGLMSFMYEENSVSIGSILEPKEDRRRYAAASAYFNAQNEIYVQLFQTPDEAEEEDNIRKLRRVAEGEVSEADKACRYCLVESGELVAPCECKGSGQWVHLSCLRQWQKSVLLTQSTHPKYQTRIDEICNVCERPFKEAYKPRSRREALLEYTGEELPQLIQKGNLLAMRSACGDKGQGGKHWKVRHMTSKAASNSEGGETTVVLTRLPKTLTAEILLGLLDELFPCAYDYFYLPMDMGKFENRGLAYINFRSHEKAVECQNHFEGTEDWKGHTSERPCKSDWSSIQGYAANIQRQQRSAWLTNAIPEGCKPMAFDEHGMRLPTLDIFPASLADSRKDARSCRTMSDNNKEWWRDQWYGSSSSEQNAGKNRKSCRWYDSWSWKSDDWRAFSDTRARNRIWRTINRDPEGLHDEYGEASQNSEQFEHGTADGKPEGLMFGKHREEEKKNQAGNDDNVAVKVSTLQDQPPLASLLGLSSNESAALLKSAEAVLATAKYACPHCGAVFMKWSSRPKSEKNGELMRQQPGAFATRLGHFTEAVYLIALCEPYNPNKRGGGAVLGVNLVQKIPSPLERTTRPVLQQGPDVEVTTYPLREWQSSYAPLVQVLQAARVLTPRAVEHFLGGPVEPSEAFALVEIPTEVLDAAKRASNNFAVDPGIRRQLASCFELLSPQRIAQLSRLRVKGSIYFGELGVILGLLASIFVQVGAGDGYLLGDAPLKVFWGYASWNATQLLGEIARRGWGLVVTDANMSFSTWEQTVASWKVVVDKSIVARESEYSN
ncbi:UBE2J2 [Symbiodinium microadriaticum]|nr:UBE2J2 [Symbiodinium microadriaticum]